MVRIGNKMKKNLEFLAKFTSKKLKTSVEMVNFRIFRPRKTRMTARKARRDVQLKTDIPMISLNEQKVYPNSGQNFVEETKLRHRGVRTPNPTIGDIVPLNTCSKAAGEQQHSLDVQNKGKLQKCPSMDIELDDDDERRTKSDMKR